MTLVTLGVIAVIAFTLHDRGYKSCSYEWCAKACGGEERIFRHFGVDNCWCLSDDDHAYRYRHKP